jgi:hypothetical protein
MCNLRRLRYLCTNTVALMEPRPLMASKLEKCFECGSWRGHFRFCGPVPGVAAVLALLPTLRSGEDRASRRVSTLQARVPAPHSDGNREK